MLIKNPAGPSTPPSFGYLFKFPRKDVVDKFKNKGWLKPETEVELKTGFISGNEYNVELIGNFFNKYYWVLYFSSLLLYWCILYPLNRAGIIPSWWLPISLALIALPIAGASLNFRKGSDRYKSLGYIETSELFLKFLNKFARPRRLKIAKIPGRIFWSISRTFKKDFYRRQWWIEYGLLIEAYRLFEENPKDFEKAVNKARNGKEFLMAVGIS